MTKPTLPNSNKSEKSNKDNQPNPYEILCTKLHQIKSIANVAVKCQDVEQQELFDVLCGVVDALTEACQLCDNLRPQDVPAYQKNRLV